MEASLFVAILSEANPATGVCHGSAGLFSSFFGIPSTSCRKWLESLEAKGYIRRFPVPGSHRSYPILVHKFKCSDGARSGYLLSAVESTDMNHLVYYKDEEQVKDVVKQQVEHEVEHQGGRVEKREKRIEKRTIAPSAPALSAAVPPAELPELELSCLPAGTSWPVVATQIRKWSEAFPGVVVRHELQRMQLWLEANPKRMKTYGGMSQFCLTWLTKSQNSSSGGLPAREAPAKSALYDANRYAQRN